MSWWRAVMRYRVTWLADDYLVRAPHSSHWRPFLFSIVLLTAGLAALVVFEVAPGDSWLRLPAGALTGGLVAMTGMSVTRRMVAYRHGWLMGRSAMIGALVEAWKRELSLDDWLRSQAEADAALMGLDLRAFTEPRQETDE